MAQRTEKFTVTTAAGSTGTATQMRFDDADVVAIEVYIPDGHAGKTGIQIWYNDTPVLPRVAGRSFVGNNVSRRIELEGYPIGSGWVAITTNSDVYAHAHQVTFELDELEPIDPELDIPVLILPLAS